MRVSFIPPFDVLSDFTDQLWHLNLPQLMSNSTYRTHFNNVYQKRRNQVIMDNGAAEHTPMSMSDLIKIAREKNPGELAIPDVLGDSDATFELAKKFFKSWFPHPAFTDNSTRLGYVVQGNSGICAYDKFSEFMVSEEGRFIEVAYLPRLLIDSGSVDETRFTRIWLAEQIHRDYPDLDIHFFGASSGFPEEVLIASQHNFIRSIDTSLPWQLAIRGEKLEVKGTWHSEAFRPPDYFTRKWSPRELKLAAKNVEIFEDWAHA